MCQGFIFTACLGRAAGGRGVDLTGRNRTINRQKLDLATFEGELSDQSTLRYYVFSRYAQLLQARSASSAFHPHGTQKVVDCGEASFALLRLSPDGSQHVLCLHNIACQSQTVMINSNDISDLYSDQFTDLITNERIGDPLNGKFVLRPYQTLWLRITE